MCVEQSLIDITTHRLTRSVTMRAAFIGGPLLSIAAIANNQPGKIGVMALSFTATLLTFMTLSLASKRGIGAGDVRLAAVLAMFLGYLGAQYVVQGLALGFMLGGVVALLLLISRKATRNTRIWTIYMYRRHGCGVVRRVGSHHACAFSRRNVRAVSPALRASF
jgi:leader peptidase (prepilin peptidase)/N-methyltransferase